MKRLAQLSFAAIALTLGAYTAPVITGQAISQAAAPVSEESAKSFITKMSGEGLAFLGNANLTMPQKKKRFKALLDTHFDIKTIAQFALGIHWKTAKDQQKKEYLDLFENMVVNVYARRFSEYNGQKFEVQSSRKRGKRDYIVSSIIKPPANESGPEVAVDWRVRNKNGQLKVIDISVEGISMIMTQRADFASVIQKGKGDIEFLLTELRKSN